MAASRLSIYNNALTRFLGERKLSGLTEAREPRYLLDDVWDSDGVKTCLQEAQWNFAIRTTQMDYDTGIAPDFGYRRAFAKPSDYVRLAGFCSDEFFKQPINHYQDNSGYWFCDYETIYVRYVSSDTDYGLDYSKWPPNFARFVEAWFALQIASRIATDRARAMTEADVEKLLKKAKATDSQEEPVGMKPLGSWSRARLTSTRRDIGRRGSLY